MELKSNTVTKEDEIDPAENMTKSSSCTVTDVEAVPLNKEVDNFNLYLENGQPSTEDETTTCKLCLEEELFSSQMFTIKSCECSFCLECMKSYLEVLIKDGVVLSISCPDADCPTSGTFAFEEIQQLCQHDTFDKYKRLKFEQEVAVDPHRTFCPGVSCSNVCHVCSNSNAQAWPHDPFPVSCPKWKANHHCNDFATSFSSEFQKFQSRAGFSFTGGTNAVIKRCPVCNILIEKDRGCAQMICKNCSHVFCWYCLKLLDNDFMLRHYDKGPCRNMLGHSRAQVYRHRIGVVGLFAAFSLLLVVASPVLLLAAPVILCCKCKECCQQAINRANQHRESIDLQITGRGAADERSSTAGSPAGKDNDVEAGLERTTQAV